MFNFPEGVSKEDKVSLDKSSTKQKIEKTELEDKTEKALEILVRTELTETEDLQRKEWLKREKRSIIETLKEVKNSNKSHYRSPPDLVDYFKETLEFLPIELRQDKELLGEIFCTYDGFWLSLEQKKNQQELFFSALPESVKGNPELVLHLVLLSINPLSNMEKLSMEMQEKLYGDPGFLLEFFRKNYLSTGAIQVDAFLKKLPMEMREDEDFIIKLGVVNANFFKYSLSKIENDEEKLRGFLLNKNIEKPFQTLYIFEGPIKDKLLKDGEFILLLLQKTEEYDPIDYLELMSSPLLSNDPFLKKAILVHPRFISKEQRRNPETILDLFQKSQDRARFIHLCPSLDDSLTTNQDFIKRGVEIDPKFAMFFSKKNIYLDEHKAYLLELTQINGAALFYFLFPEKKEFILETAETLTDPQLTQLINEMKLEGPQKRHELWGWGQNDYDEVLKFLNKMQADRKMKSIAQKKNKDTFFNFEK